MSRHVREGSALQTDKLHKALMGKGHGPHEEMKPHAFNLATTECLVKTKVQRMKEGETLSKSPRTSFGSIQESHLTVPATPRRRHIARNDETSNGQVHGSIC